MGPKLILDVFVAQQAHVWGQFAPMHAQETAVQMERRKESDLRRLARFGADRRGGCEEAP